MPAALRNLDRAPALVGEIQIEATVLGDAHVDGAPRHIELSPGFERIESRP
jgi:hypothetical protein